MVSPEDSRTQTQQCGTRKSVPQCFGIGSFSEPDFLHEATNSNWDAAPALSQICSERTVAVRNHEWGRVEGPRDSSRGARCSVLRSGAEALSPPEFWTGLDSSVSAPPPPIPMPGNLTAIPAVKASKAQQRREAEDWPA